MVTLREAQQFHQDSIDLLPTISGVKETEADLIFAEIGEGSRLSPIWNTSRSWFEVFPARISWTCSSQWNADGQQVFVYSTDRMCSGHRIDEKGGSLSKTPGVCDQEEAAERDSPSAGADHFLDPKKPHSSIAKSL